MKAKMMKTIRTMGMTAFLLGAAFLMAGCGRRAEIELMDYVRVEFSGLDGEGTAQVSWDMVSVEVDVVEALAKGEDEASLEEAAKELGNFAKFEDSVECKLDKAEGLKNGDKVTVTVSYDKESAKESKIKVEGELEKTFEVQGLQEQVELDPFDSQYFNREDGIEIDYLGTAPFATASVKCHLPENHPLSKVKYTLDKTENLENGDTITVTAKVRDDYVSEGYTLKETTTSVKVEGMRSYVTEMTEQMWGQLKPYCDERITEELDGVFYIVNGDEMERYTQHDVSSVNGADYGPELRVAVRKVREESEQYNGVLIPYSIKATMQDGVTLGADRKAVGYLYIENLIQDEQGRIDTDKINVRMSDYSYTTEKQAEEDCVDQVNYDFYPFQLG